MNENMEKYLSSDAKGSGMARCEDEQKNALPQICLSKGIIKRHEQDCISQSSNVKSRIVCECNKN